MEVAILAPMITTVRKRTVRMTARSAKAKRKRNSSMNKRTKIQIAVKVASMKDRLTRKKSHRKRRKSKKKWNCVGHD